MLPLVSAGGLHFSICHHQPFNPARYTHNLAFVDDGTLIAYCRFQFCYVLTAWTDVLCTLSADFTARYPVASFPHNLGTRLDIRVLKFPVCCSCSGDFTTTFAKCWMLDTCTCSSVTSCRFGSFPSLRITTSSFDCLKYANMEGEGLGDLVMYIHDGK